MSIKTILLEKEYEKTIADSTRLLDAERDRARRMEYLLLQFESENLRLQLDEANARLQGSARTEAEMLLQLDHACQEISRLERGAAISSSEIGNLKAELSTLNESSTSHKKLMSENVRLSRDVANLTSELERLKSQSASQQAASVGRSEIERQLNALEVELENERHAHERTRAKGVQQAAGMNALMARIEELQGEIVRESRAKQQREIDERQQFTAWENKRSALESKIETLKKQLRSTKDKLQETQHDLQQRRSFARVGADEEPEPRTRMVPLQRAGSSANYQEGVTIATPGAVRVQDKANRQSALPGDKSVFSITPFLNRTGAPRDSSTSSEAEEDEPRDKIPKPSGLPDKIRTLNGMGMAVAGDGSPEPIPGKRPFAAVSKSFSKIHEDQPLSISRKASTTIPRRDAGDPRDTLVDPGQARQPRKRKLGAQRGDRALFDEDVEEGAFEGKKPGRKVGLGGSRPSAFTTSQPPGAPSGAERLPRTLGLGTFSPLKRDHKSASHHLGDGKRVNIKINLPIDEKYRIFKRGQTVVDLGYAPGSWSQVAVGRTQPNGRVLGVDIIPAQPPRGVSTIQGNFLAPEIQAYIKEFLRSPNRGRPRQSDVFSDVDLSLLEPEQAVQSRITDTASTGTGSTDRYLDRTVDVVLSDMSAPWMMNTSGNNFRDHVGSMDLCHAALSFATVVLKVGGHFVCKFYQGAEDKELEKELKDRFQKVHRLKPESSRSESKEAFFVGLDRRE
ncbi:hypothetical protein N7468_010474 [Penicillium chermesinum]|uniref:rRNA methyltransferase 2, mitochondrial n=1 Tax=Penicillium chermesinum TaxID=63820 RepID=A0A9W9N7Q2_9EURO|nr:uncharacterized protein N7468_010474 [Penicillium chermesinum]KAJ5214795.1 hypothetical protein N7468_010474 [Penicillium chermesinum]KAJ6140442.1 hypothetical protein N7470_010447 [Penicillium chermesinum]